MTVGHDPGLSRRVVPEEDGGTNRWGGGLRGAGDAGPRRPTRSTTTGGGGGFGEDDEEDRRRRRHHRHNDGGPGDATARTRTRSCTCHRHRGGGRPRRDVHVAARDVLSGGGDGEASPDRRMRTSGRPPEDPDHGGGGGGTDVVPGNVTLAPPTTTTTTGAVRWEEEEGGGGGHDGSSSSTFVHLDPDEGGGDDGGDGAPGRPAVGPGAGSGDGVQRTRDPLLRRRWHGGGGGRQLKHRHAGFLDAATHASVLVRAGRGDDPSKSSSCGGEEEEDGGVSLCRSCVERVTSAVEANVERLRGECRSYEDAVSAAEAKEEEWNRRRIFDVNDDDGQDGDDSSDEMRAVRSYLDEISTLTSECEAHLSDLDQLRTLVHRQLVRADDLRRLHEVELPAHVTAVDLAAHRSFPDAVDVATASACAAMDESEAVMGVRLLPILFDVDVPPPIPAVTAGSTPDQNHHGGYGGGGGDGTHPNHLTPPPSPPPTINGLRLLSHRRVGHGAPVGWDEVNAAWSQAAQLLLFAGGAVNFVSPDYRIVPLASSCAKIIEIDRSTGRKRRVHNLGVESSSARRRSRDDDGDDGEDATLGRPDGDDGPPLTDAIRAFRKLLGQLVRHLSDEGSGRRVPSSSSSSGTDPTKGAPYGMTMTLVSTGNDVAVVDDDDRGGWSDVVRGIADDLRWVAEFAPDTTAVVAD